MTPENPIKKGRTKSAPPPLIDPKLVDEFVDVREKWKSWQPNVNPHAARYAELEEQLLEAANTQPAKKAVVLEGIQYRVPVSPRENKSVIKSIFAVEKKLGLQWLINNCSLALAKVRAAFPKESWPTYIATTRTGPREIQEPVRK